MHSFDPSVAAFIAAHRVARLATADARGAPHVVPVCYACDGSRIYSAIDLKPKRAGATVLKRVRNILQNPLVALVIDDYGEDWRTLAYVLIQGRAEVLEHGCARQRAECLLREKYPQYRELLAAGCMILSIEPTNVAAWGRI
jgi:PPOX class probable F420-dependent enzyme